MHRERLFVLLCVRCVPSSASVLNRCFILMTFAIKESRLVNLAQSKPSHLKETFVTPVKRRARKSLSGNSKASAGGLTVL